VVEGADLGQQPQQHPEQDADRHPHADHQRRRDGALGQDGVPGQGRVAHREGPRAEPERGRADVGPVGMEALRVAGDQAAGADPAVVQLHAGERLGRAHRRPEAVVGPELPGGPAGEPPAPLGDAVAGLVAPVHGHEQLEGDRSSVRGQVEVAGEGGLVAQGGPAGVAGLLERGHDAGDGPGVGAQRRAERDPRVAVLGDVVDRPPARRLDGEARLAVPAGPGHEAGRLVVGDHRAPADPLEPRVAVAEVEAAGEGAELGPVHRVRGQPQRPRRLEGVLVGGQGAGDRGRARGGRPVQALVALAAHGRLPAPGDQERRHQPQGGHDHGRAPEHVGPARRPVAPERPPAAPDRHHAYRIDQTGRRLKPAGPPPSRPGGAGGV
jgi:hypothetical protein